MSWRRAAASPVEPAKNTPQTNPYLKRLVAQSPWKPKLQGVFAGELDYSRYGPVDKYMMRLVMWINKGPTDFATKVEFTNWDDVERFAGEVAKLTAGADVAVLIIDSHGRAWRQGTVGVAIGAWLLWRVRPDGLWGCKG